MRFVAFVASLFIRVLGKSLRLRHVNAEHMTDTPQYIIAFWHAHLLLMLHCRFRTPISVMISRSKDGEYIARVFDWFGVDAIRGSTSRGGSQALREIVRRAREGHNIGFTPDGPRGPARKVQPGVIYTAQATGLPIVPVAFAAQKKNFSAHGTEWSYRIRSRRRCSSTDRRCMLRVTRTCKTRSRVWSERSTTSRSRRNAW